MKKSSILTPPPKAIIVATAKAVIVATAKAVIVATAKAVIVATAKAWGYKSKLISMGADATFNNLLLHPLCVVLSCLIP